MFAHNEIWTERQIKDVILFTHLIYQKKKITQKTKPKSKQNKIKKKKGGGMGRVHKQQ